MSPKKKNTVKEKRKSAVMAKKPSPKKMSPQKSPSVTLKMKESATQGANQGILQQTPSENSQSETPTRDNSKVQSPRSNERYDLRNITPPSYRNDSRTRIYKTPLRTPSGIPRRTLARGIGRTPNRTPYRTPKLKSFSSHSKPDRREAYKSNKEAAVIWKEHLRTITGKTFKLCNLSTMSNFRYQNDRLRKKYENHLKNKVLEVYPSPSLSVSLSTSSCLTLQPNAVDAVRIEIISTLMGDNADDDEKFQIYNAWLFHTSKTQSRPIVNAEWFPLMLYRGKELIHHAVIDWLQGSFGCYIAKYGIRQSDLMWIAGAWSGQPCPLPSHSKRDGNKVHLNYLIHPPQEMKGFTGPYSRGRSRIKFSIALKDVHHIWKQIVNNRHHMTEEELYEFFTAMNSLAQKVAFLPPYLLSLHQLQTPCIRLTSDGMVRVSCTDSVKIIVGHLIDLFVQTSYSFQDETSAEISQDTGRDNTLENSGNSTTES